MATSAGQGSMFAVIRLMLRLIVVFKSAVMMLWPSIYNRCSDYCLLGAKKKKKLSVFDEELTNTSRKALKQYRAG